MSSRIRRWMGSAIPRSSSPLVPLCQYFPPYAQFLQQLITNYEPAPYEFGGADLYGTAKHQHWAAQHSRRFHHVLTQLAPYLVPGARVVDLGAYPGSLLKILRSQYGNDLDLVAAGMPVDPRFPSDMDQLSISFVPVDLDTCGRTPYPNRLALKDQSVDIVICTEMLEHLYSLRPFFEEVTRVLKPGGVLFVDTNNVAYLLGILRLLRGETNLDLSLEHTSALAESEWRGHVRFYSLRQLRELATRYGMTVPASGYFQMRAPKMMVAPSAVKRWWLSRVLDAIVAPFPVYKSHLWMVAQRPR